MLTRGAPAGSTTEWLCHWRQSRAPPGSSPPHHTCPARPLSWEQSDEARSETPPRLMASTGTERWKHMGYPEAAA